MSVSPSASICQLYSQFVRPRRGWGMYRKKRIGVQSIKVVFARCDFLKIINWTISKEKNKLSFGKIHFVCETRKGYSKERNPHFKVLSLSRRGKTFQADHFLKIRKDKRGANKLEFHLFRCGFLPFQAGKTFRPTGIVQGVFNRRIYIISVAVGAFSGGQDFSSQLRTS